LLLGQEFQDAVFAFDAHLLERLATDVLGLLVLDAADARVESPYVSEQVQYVRRLRRLSKSSDTSSGVTAHRSRLDSFF